MSRSSTSVESAIYNYSAVKRWVEQKLLPKEIGSNRKKTTKGFGSFICGLVLYIPINWKGHWILAAVHMDRQVISLYDSLCPTLSRRFHDGRFGIFGLAILRCLHEFYQEWHLGKFEPDEWTCHFSACAHQGNMVDCGVFMVGFIHKLVCGIPTGTCTEGGSWRNFILSCFVAGEIKCPPAIKMRT
jgi:hypothetical protein